MRYYSREFSGKPKIVRRQLVPANSREAVWHRVEAGISLYIIKGLAIPWEIILRIHPSWIELAFPIGMVPAGATDVWLHVKCSELGFKKHLDVSIGCITSCQGNQQHSWGLLELHGAPKKELPFIYD